MRTRLIAAMAGGFFLFGQAVAAGYLPAGGQPDMVKILPPAPPEGSPGDLADRAIFRNTRALKGSPRWLLARSDVPYATSDLLRDFSCAVGVTLTVVNAPKLTALLTKMNQDLFPAVDAPKKFYNRKRPFQNQPGDICVEQQREALKHNADYPSGHAALAWATGLILAEINPAHATAIMLRARAFGESRAVCGVHNASAVSAGQMDATALVAVLHGEAAFRADLETARQELAGLRSSPPPVAEMCDSEAAVTAQAPW